MTAHSAWEAANIDHSITAKRNYTINACARLANSCTVAVTCPVCRTPSACRAPCSEPRSIRTRCRVHHLEPVGLKGGSNKLLAEKTVRLCCRITLETIFAGELLHYFSYNPVKYSASIWNDSNAFCSPLRISVSCPGSIMYKIIFTSFKILYDVQKRLKFSKILRYLCVNYIFKRCLRGELNSRNTLRIGKIS